MQLTTGIIGNMNGTKNVSHIFTEQLRGGKNETSTVIIRLKTDNLNEIPGNNLKDNIEDENIRNLDEKNRRGLA